MPRVDLHAAFTMLAMSSSSPDLRRALRHLPPSLRHLAGRGDDGVNAVIAIRSFLAARQALISVAEELREASLRTGLPLDHTTLPEETVKAITESAHRQIDIEAETRGGSQTTFRSLAFSFVAGAGTIAATTDATPTAGTSMVVGLGFAASDVVQARKLAELQDAVRTHEDIMSPLGWTRFSKESLEDGTYDFTIEGPRLIEHFRSLDDEAQERARGAYTKAMKFTPIPDDPNSALQVEFGFIQACDDVAANSDAVGRFLIALHEITVGELDTFSSPAW